MARHALAWLVLANAVGVLLAVLLLHPRLAVLLGAAGYGRWMPVHMNGQLYGWCALPLAGLLLKMYWENGYDGGRGAQASWALRGWSLALACGCAAWLLGVTSGKLFMDWHGWARPVLPLAMLGLWVMLAGWEESRNDTRGRVGRVTLLIALFCVPWIFWLAAGRGVFPTVNPDSGGATGTALLGSTLGIILVHGLAPRALGLGAGKASNKAGSVPGVHFWRRAYWGWAIVSMVLFACVDHGDASHHGLGQILALGSLLVWAPLSWGYLRSFEWPAGAGRWLVAGLLWWAVLLASGWLTFLPGMSERLKFTHALVAHAHLALAAYVSSLNWALLIALGAKAPGRWSFGLWQGACAVHIAVLAVLGALEQEHTAQLFLGAPWVQGLLSVRMLTGLVMLGVSLAWLVRQCRRGNETGS